jgi:hypothetical protein
VRYGSTSNFTQGVSTGASCPSARGELCSKRISYGPGGGSDMKYEDPLEVIQKWKV